MPVARHLLLALVTLAGAGAVAAQTRDPAVLALPGLIVDEARLARDTAGRAVEPSIPGVRRAAGLDAAASARLAELEAARAAAARAAPGAAFSPLPPLSGDAAAPARVDSGDPDPDRLFSAPPAPAP
ncbi:MAG: hypothetical protein SF182_23340 [Deltaproteobacteria bacterium]|nr:hypothetical protein [Deltaproteobacteria bacterium]